MNKKLFLLLLPLLFLFPKNTFAKSLSFTYDSNQSYYCVNNSCTSTTLGYFNYAGNTYYRFIVPYNSGTYSVNILALNSITSIDVTDYDYILMNVISTNGLYLSSGKFTKSNVYGYALTSNYSVPTSYTSGSTVFFNTPSYTTILKFDVSDIDTLYGNLNLFFTQSLQNSQMAIQESFGIYIDVTLYLGKYNDAVSQAIEKNTEESKKTNDLIESTDTSDAQSTSSSFFKDFSSDSHGLSGIITAPLSFLQALTSAKCNPLTFDLPFVDKTVTLPCMKGIYENYFGIFFTLWQTITTGVISYCVCLNFYKKIRDLQNPNNDKIEVLNL